jgi:hypothetical protein
MMTSGSFEREIVRNSGNHFYNTSIRTRPVKRELAAVRAAFIALVPAYDEERKRI